MFDFLGRFIPLREDRVVLAGILVVWLVLVSALTAKGVPALRFGSYLSNLILYAATLFLILVPIAFRELYRERPHSPIRFLYERLKSRAVRNRIARGLPMIVALVIFMPAFSAMKSAIPLFNDYTWDATWIALDKQIHGADPWRLLQPLLGYPMATSFVSLAYHVWVLLIYVGGVYFALFENDRKLRCRYFIGFFSIWTLIGIVMATTFASVGPCFIEPLLGLGYYEEQMDYLRSANERFPILVLDVQQSLLTWYLEGNRGLGRGITAMPSMHVALVTLFFFAIKAKSRSLSTFFGIFSIVIVIGSVHLAYHYAVDAYVSILVTIVIWKLTGSLASMIVGEGVVQPALAVPPNPGLRNDDKAANR